VEYATYRAFRSTATLGPLYGQLIRETMLSVKAEQGPTFLDCPITPKWRRKSAHSFPPGSREPTSSTASAEASIKMCDKHAIRPPGDQIREGDYAKLDARQVRA
jgi:hypothetical protein